VPAGRLTATGVLPPGTLAPDWEPPIVVLEPGGDHLIPHSKPRLFEKELLISMILASIRICFCGTSSLAITFSISL